MMKEKYKPAARAAVIILAFSLLSAVISFLSVAFSGNILLAFGEEVLGNIFMQIKVSSVLPAFLVPLILFCALYFLLRPLYRKTKGKKIKIFFIVLCIILFITVTLLTVLFTTVNGITVISVASSLIDGLKHGLAEELRVAL